MKNWLAQIAYAMAKALLEWLEKPRTQTARMAENRSDLRLRLVNILRQRMPDAGRAAGASRPDRDVDR